MNALCLPFGSIQPSDRIHFDADEPVALLQVDVRSLWAAASTVYREVRKGRRVIVVAGGAVDAPLQLAGILDRIGVTTNCIATGSALLSEGVSIVPGPIDMALVPSAPTSRPFRVALAGCGVVGGGVLEQILNDDRFELAGALVRDRTKPRSPAIPSHLIVSDPGALLAREPDVVVEALSDASVALSLMRAALARGVHVVSASKQALAFDLRGLEHLAEAHSVELRYSASVGGGVPMIETIRRAGARGRIVRLEGVFNGTSNFILDRIASGGGFQDAVEAARAAGFAEEDPSADLDGRDAGAKLRILTRLACGRDLGDEEVELEPLGPSSVEPGVRMRHVASYDVSTDLASVRLELAGTAPVHGCPEGNHIRVTLDTAEVLTAKGRGAGRLPTTASVWADLLDIHDVAASWD